jgi:hypothetical protein
MGRVTPEVFVPSANPAGRMPLATHVRSTLIVSSLQTLRSRGLLDRYLALLEEKHREELLSLIAGTWVPIEVGLAHYRAADRLGLESALIDSIGAEVGERINKSFLSFVVRMSKEAGVTPWTALARAHRLRELTWKGSDLQIWKLGPKDARFDWGGLPYAVVPYFVTSFGGFVRGLIQLFCTKAYARPVPEKMSQTFISYRISWV